MVTEKEVGWAVRRTRQLLSKDISLVRLTWPADTPAHIVVGAHRALCEVGSTWRGQWSQMEHSGHSVTSYLPTCRAEEPSSSLSLAQRMPVLPN